MELNLNQIEIQTVLEVIYGMSLFVFGVDGFFKKIPIPEPKPKAREFLIALENTGYLMPLIKWIEMICGLMLVLRICPFLSLVVLSPIILNIFLFQYLLNRGQSKIGWILLLVHLTCLGFRYQNITQLCV